jgi:hypothetical protein
MKKFLQVWIFSLLILSLQNLSCLYATVGYSSSSVLASGQWFKIAVTHDGIYRIDYSKLKQLGLTFPSNPKIYGNNFGQLSYFNDDPKPDDLKEISVLLVNGSDGIFNEGDYLLFYGMGTHRWKYNSAENDYDFVRHNYSDTAYYFLTSSPEAGRIISNAPEVLNNPDYFSTSYDALYSHEVETENLIKSGREWFQPVSSINGIEIEPGFSEIITSEKMEFDMSLAGRASVSTVFRLYEGTNIVADTMVSGVDLFSSTGAFANIAEQKGSFYPASSSPVYKIEFYNNGEQEAKGWIDFVRLHGRATTVFSGNTIRFSDSRSVQAGRITEFNIKSSLSGFSIWDVTDPFNPQIVRYVKTGEDNKFIARTDSIKTFVSFSPDKPEIPVIRAGQVSNQDLHGSGPADMVIVTHPLFLSYAEKLAAIHFASDGLETQIVTPEEIYNEYSGGIPDIVAIRNFMRMKYLKQKGSSHPLKYLLLFGDGSYENKTLPPGNPNYVPTYQSINSTVIVSSFTSDDFYGLLDDGEGEADGTEDIGIGRFPVSDTAQAGIMVSKVKKYLSEASTGDWRNIICITADDEDGNTHMIDAEGLYSLLNSDYPSFNIDKIYLDAFKQVTSVGGQSYPEVNKAINDRINAGCLIFNYLGHGSENGLAHERVVRTDDINSWKNSSKLALFITATCEFSRFDDVEINPATREIMGKNSAGEMVILNPDGGGIALMTTTRVVYSGPNYILNRNIYDQAFRKDSAGNAFGLGDIIRFAKLNSGNGPNKRNFLLLGDPAVKLAWPWHGKIVTDSVNNISVLQPIDSLKALSLITISGHAEDNDGNTLSDFNGVVSPIVFDKTNRIKTLANDGGEVMEFDLRNNVLFNGKTTASAGKFRFTFIVPKDINYSFGNGKISYYANQGEKDLAGNFTDVIVGGFSNSSLTDTSGPEIKLYLNDTLFRDGGITDDNPVLLAIIEDKGGINTTGSGIGHDLIASLDNDRNKTLVLNNYFETDFDNYMKGTLTYPIGNISDGSHSVTLKAWDNFNNSSETSVRFIVRTQNGFIINNLINYPNPFTDHTSISAEHNRPNENLTIRISIYSMNGRLIKNIMTSVPSTGYKLPPIEWDGNDDGGKRVGRGIYPYSVTISTENGEAAKASGRMIIL